MNHFVTLKDGDTERVVEVGADVCATAEQAAEVVRHEQADIYDRTWESIVCST